MALIQISTTQLALQTDIQKSTCEFSHFSDQKKKKLQGKKGTKGMGALHIHFSFHLQTTASGSIVKVSSAE